MILLSYYLNLAFKETYNNNQKSNIIKRKLCGFVGNFEKNDINFNDPLYEQIFVLWGGNFTPIYFKVCTFQQAKT